MDQFRKSSSGDASPSPVFRHLAPTTQTSYVTANASPKPSPKLAHAQIQANLAPFGLGYPIHSVPTSQVTSPIGSVLNSPKLGEKSRLPSFSKGMSAFVQNGFAMPEGNASVHNGGIGSGTTSPGILSNNVSFVSAEQYLRTNGGASDVQYPQHPGLIRSRRSSAALVVSVSLASRARSRTPVQKIGSPPTSPSRRMSREIGSTSGGAMLGQVDEGVPSTTVTKKHGKWDKGNGNGDDIEFADFGWDEAFEDDEDDYPSVSRQSQRKSLAGRGVERFGDSASDDTTGMQVEIHNMEIKDTNGWEGREHDDDDIFPPGHRIGEGTVFDGEIIEDVDPVARSKENGRSLPQSSAGSIASLRESGFDHEHSGRRKTFEVVRKLGSGSYAVVYLVKEIGGTREYALKCLSKRDLEGDALHVQLFEATIHMSLPRHQNIVTLYQTLQTKKWLFLLLEMCPGEDLFYWLEHSRDSPPASTVDHKHPGLRADSPEFHPHGRNIPLSSSNLPSSAVPFSTSAMISGMGTPHGLGHSPVAFSHRSHLSHEMHSPYSSTHNHGSNGHMAAAATPTTPSLLSAYSANALLSARRLKLIASMFAQMCEAVALCHDIGVSHRDIKPENFICCDSEELASARDGDDYAGLGRKKVIVKLTDFGLATTDETSGDVECGSRPYMAYECRNELGPSYEPRPADVWSLGVVLLNMLFHRNPWTDPVPGNKNFDGFLDDPVEFLLSRFTGIGREVAAYLAECVFNVNIDRRTSAREFGRWARHLPSMIGGKKAVSALRMSYLSGGAGKDRGPLEFKKSPIEPRGVASSMPKSTNVLNGFAPISAHSLQVETKARQNGPDVEEQDSAEVTPRLNSDEATFEDSAVEPVRADTNADSTLPDGVDDSASRPISAKRKKRGTRSKNKAASAAAAALMAGLDLPKAPEPPALSATLEKEAVLLDLAEASQTLARQLSKATRSAEGSVIDLDEFPKLGEEVKPGDLKESRWKALMSKSHGNPELQALIKKVQERDGSFAYRSAPAKLQHVSQGKAAASTTSRDQANASTPMLSLSPSSVASTFNPTQSLPLGLESDNWRRSPATTKNTPNRALPVSIAAQLQQEDDRGRNVLTNGRARRPDGSLNRLKRPDGSDISAVPTLGWSQGTSPIGSNQTYAMPSSHYSGYSTSPSTIIANQPVIEDARTPSSQHGKLTTPPPASVKRSSSTEGDGISKPPLSKNKSANMVNRPALESISERPAPLRKDNTRPSNGLNSPSGLDGKPYTHISQQDLGPPSAPLSPPPPKLKQQIASLGKMLSGLKTSRGKD